MPRRSTAQLSFVGPGERRYVVLGPRDWIADSEDVPPNWVPKTRADCKRMGLGWSVPCPFFRCKFNLRLDAERRAGGYRLVMYWPDREYDELPATCADEVAAHGARTSRELAAVTGIPLRSLERIMNQALAKLKRRAPELLEAWRDHENEREGG